MFGLSVFELHLRFLQLYCPAVMIQQEITPNIKLSLVSLSPIYGLRNLVPRLAGF